MKKLFMILPLVLVLCFANACQQAEQVADEPAVDIAAETEAVRETDVAWAKAAEEKDAEKMISFMADDFIRVLGSANGSRGREAEGEALSRFFIERGGESTWRPEKVVVAASGDLAFTYGKYINEREVEGETVKNEGGYLAIWKKQADGSWKLVALK